MRVRIKFAKEDAMKYIGHLDVMRYFQKAIRRAGIRVAYSGGFSPHMLMSFAAPLGVGITSVGEYFDLALADDETRDGDTLLSLLSAEMASGFSVLQLCAVGEEKKDKAMRLVSAADYALFIEDEAQRLAVAASIDKLLDLDSYEVTRMTKKGARSIDIRPLIYRLEADPACIRMRISQGSANNLRPELVLFALANLAGQDPDGIQVRIHRVELYSGEDPAHLTPLSELGEAF